jgi:hypothetical protein
MGTTPHFRREVRRSPVGSNCCCSIDIALKCAIDRNKSDVVAYLKKRRVSRNKIFVLPKARGKKCWRVMSYIQIPVGVALLRLRLIEPPPGDP